MNFENLFKNKNQLLIAEIGQSHDGSINYVHSFIDQAKKNGADIIKFQAHFAEEESTYDDKFRTKTSYKNENRFEYWKRMEFSLEEWSQIYKHVKKKKMLFSSSVFSNFAIEQLNKTGIDIWKISSGESLSLDIIKRVTSLSKKPVIVSTGMSYENEVDNIYRFFRNKKNPLIIMHCVSEYPCKINNIGLNIIKKFKKKYNCKIGYSDHSGNLEVPLVSLGYDINALEVHVVFNKNLFNPDASSSITFQELKFLRKYIDTRYILNNSKITKNEIAKKVKLNRSLFSKSLALNRNMKKNEIITSKDLTYKKPGSGISYKFKKNLIGTKLIKNKSKFFLLKWNDVKKK